MMLALWALVALADTRTVSATPSEVVVYADRARVTRAASVELPVGQHALVFEGLPATLLDTGVSAEVSAGTLGAIDLRKVAASEIADVRVAEIERELDRLSDARRVTKDDETAAAAELTSLEAGKAAAARALSQQLLYSTRAAERVRLVRTKVATEEERARDALREARQKGREIDEQVAALTRERDSLGTSGTDTWTATVQVDVARPGRITVELAYLVRGATWRPRYDVRGSTSTGKVDLSLSALVTQNTGEDWTDVKLAVTTARAGQGTDVPTLDPFWLEPPVYYAPQMSSRSMSAPAAAAPMEDMGPGAYDYEEVVPMEVAIAVVQMDLAATTFEVARDESVPADGTERKVLLTTQALDADLRHIVVPRIDPRAYLVGEVTNTAAFALLEGEAGVFLDGAYLGDFTMSRVAPGATFDVAFGVDDGVKVTRKSRDVKVGDVGIGGKRATSRWSWDVVTKNTHARPVKIELREQVPVSGQADVTVTWKVLDGGPTPTEESGGILVFAFDLPARAERTTSWSYQIEYPADRWLGWME